MPSNFRVSIVGEILHVGSRNWTAGSNHGRATNYVEFAFGSDRRWLPGGIWVCVWRPLPVGVVVFEGRKPPTVDSADDPPAETMAQRSN